MKTRSALFVAGLAGVAATFAVPYAAPSRAVAQVYSAQTAPPPTTGPAPDTLNGAAAPTTLPRLRPSPFGESLLRLRDISGLAAPGGWNDDGENRVMPADEDEWMQISQFAQENFPNRWKQFEAVSKQRGPEAPVVNQLRERITIRYRQLENVRQRMPDLYDAAVRQGRLEDAAWAATADARRDPKNASKAAVLRERVGALVKDVLQERQDRLDTLRAVIQNEQERLDNDVEGVDGLVDRQIARLTGDAPEGAGFRGGGGFGRRRFDFPGRWSNDNPPPKFERRIRFPSATRPAGATQPAGQ